MDTNKILDLAIDAGKIMLENGGETYRVEETMLRISKALGLQDADCYATPTVLMLNCKDQNGNNVSAVKRIVSRTFNLDRIIKINELSRSIEKKHMDINDVQIELKNVCNMPCYSKKIKVIFAAFAVGAFTLVFGGNFRDALTALLVGAVIENIIIFLSTFKVADFFIDIVGGAIAALLALIAYKLGIVQHYDKIIIGGIMLLVPGLAITNAIRDTINGDLVSGISRAVEAFIIAVAIAVGTGITLKIWFIIWGGI